jgi:pseudouridine-5'-phosphate glycosidase
VDTPEAAAQIVKATLDARLGSGCVFAVPIPSEHEAVGEEIERATTTALKEAEARGVAGRDVTPFILKRVAELTGGHSLAANVALVQNNAVVGARIAVALAALKRA